MVSLNQLVKTYLQTPECEKIKTYHTPVWSSRPGWRGPAPREGLTCAPGKMVMNLVSNAAEAISSTGEVLIRTRNVYLSKPCRATRPCRKGTTACSPDRQRPRHHPRGSGADLRALLHQEGEGRSGTGLGLAVVWGTVQTRRAISTWKAFLAKGTPSPSTCPPPGSPEGEAARTGPGGLTAPGGKEPVVDDVPEQREVATSL